MEGLVGLLSSASFSVLSISCPVSVVSRSPYSFKQIDLSEQNLAKRCRIWRLTSVNAKVKGLGNLHDVHVLARLVSVFVSGAETIQVRAERTTSDVPPLRSPNYEQRASPQQLCDVSAFVTLDRCSPGIKKKKVDERSGWAQLFVGTHKLVSRLVWFWKACGFSATRKEQWKSGATGSFLPLHNQKVSQSELLEI